MSEIVFTSGGRLLRERLEPREFATSRKSRSSRRVQEDVSSLAHEFLFDPVDVTEDVMLRDVFLLLQRCPILTAVFRRDYAKELLEHVQSNGLYEAPGLKMRTSGLTHLELYQHWRRNSRHNTFAGQGFWHLHAWGPPEEDLQQRSAPEVDSVVAYSVSLTPVSELLDLPIRVKREASVSEDDHFSRAYGAVLPDVALEDAITLGAFLHGILWELSFHGTPQEQQALAQELQRRVEEVRGEFRASSEPSALQDASEVASQDNSPEAVAAERATRPARLRRLFWPIRPKERAAYRAVFGSTPRSWPVRRIQRELASIDDSLNGHAVLHERSAGVLSVREDLRGLNARDLREALHRLAHDS